MNRRGDETSASLQDKQSSNNEEMCLFLSKAMQCYYVEMAARTQTSATSLSFFSIKENDFEFGESGQKLFEWAFRVWDHAHATGLHVFPVSPSLFVTMLNCS